MEHNVGAPGPGTAPTRDTHRDHAAGSVSWLGMAMGIWLLGGVGFFALRFATSWIHQLP